MRVKIPFLKTESRFHMMKKKTLTKFFTVEWDKNTTRMAGTLLWLKRLLMKIDTRDPHRLPNGNSKVNELQFTLDYPCSFLIQIHS